MNIWPVLGNQYRVNAQATSITKYMSKGPHISNLIKATLYVQSCTYFTCIDIKRLLESKNKRQHIKAL